MDESIEHIVSKLTLPRDFVEQGVAAAQVYDHNALSYRNLALLYTGSAAASSFFIEASRLLSGQDVTRDLSLVTWNCALSGVFGLLERYMNGVAAHDVNGRISSFLLGPVALVITFTGMRYGILGLGLNSGEGTMTGVALGGIAGLATSWRAWYVARNGGEIGVYSVIGEPLKRAWNALVSFHEPSIRQFRKLYERMENDL